MWFALLFQRHRSPAALQHGAHHLCPSHQSKSHSPPSYGKTINPNQEAENPLPTADSSVCSHQVTQTCGHTAWKWRRRHRRGGAGGFTAPVHAPSAAALSANAVVDSTAGGVRGGCRFVPGGSLVVVVPVVPLSTLGAGRAPPCRRRKFVSMTICKECVPESRFRPKTFAVEVIW